MYRLHIALANDPDEFDAVSKESLETLNSKLPSVMIATNDLQTVFDECNVSLKSKESGLKVSSETMNCIGQFRRSTLDSKL